MALSVKQIPNVITTLRLLLVPVFAYLLLSKYTAASGVVFFAAAASDAVDGFLARKLNAVSEWGRIVDPIADHSLTNTALIIMFVQGLIPAWALVFVAKDAVFFLVYAVFGKKIQTRVTKIGKLSGLCIFSAITCILTFDASWAVWLLAAGIVCAIAAFVQYMRQARSSYTDSTATSGGAEIRT